MTTQRCGLRCHRHLWGDGPHQARPFPGHGDPHLVGVCASGHQASRALTQPHWRLPPEGLERVWQHVQPAWQVATVVGGRPIGPGPVDQGASGMGVAGVGDRTLPAALTAGIFGGDQAQRFHHWSRVLKARQVAAFGQDGHGHGALHPTQALLGLDHWLPSPGVDLLAPCLLQVLEAYGVLSDRADVCLEDDRWRRGGTDDFGEPPQMRRTPSGVARSADIVPEHKGFETELGSLESTDGIFTSPAQISDGSVFHPGDIDGGEIT
jgi:hypothetical protein